MGFRANSKIGFGGFGEIISSGLPAPPSGYAYLVDDQGRYILDDQGKYILVSI
jgi:hypothetical protein